MVQVSHHRKPEYSWQSYQRRKVKDFFIKFKKKSHFADFLTEHTLDFVLHRLLGGLAEMDTDDIGWQQCAFSYSPFAVNCKVFVTDCYNN